MSRKLNPKNQLSPFFNLQKAKIARLELFTKFLTSIVMLQSLKSWRWTQTCSIQHYPDKTRNIASDEPWKRMRFLCKTETVKMIFQPCQQQLSSLVLAALTIRNTTMRTLSFKGQFRCRTVICVANLSAVMTLNQTSTLAAIGSIKKRLNNVVLVSFKYMEVLVEIVDVLSTDGWFRTMKHAVATYEQKKKRLPWFNPKGKVQQEGIQTDPLKLKF